MRDFYQAHVSPLMPFFRDGIMESFDFQEYVDPDAPTVFFGVYSRHDVKKINAHRGKKIVIYLGGDIKKYGGKLDVSNNLYHVGYGPFKKALEEKGVKVYDWNVPFKKYDMYKPVELGDKIYVYLGYHGNRANYYGMEEVVNPLIRAFGKERIIYTHGKTHEELRDDFYSKCFAYVKPNPLGGSTTMWEVGHMGIRTFTVDHDDLNYGNIVPYTKVSNLINKLKEEESRIGQIRLDVAEATKAAVSRNEDWLSLSFYE